MNLEQLAVNIGSISNRFVQNKFMFRITYNDYGGGWMEYDDGTTELDLDIAEVDEAATKLHQYLNDNSIEYTMDDDDDEGYTFIIL